MDRLMCASLSPHPLQVKKREVTDGGISKQPNSSGQAKPRMTRYFRTSCWSLPFCTSTCMVLGEVNIPRELVLWMPKMSNLEAFKILVQGVFKY